MQHHKTICVDFDGTLHKYSRGWQDGSIYDIPVDGAKEAIKRLREYGFKIVVCTAIPRDVGAVWTWLRKYDIEVDDVTNVKVSCVAFIDDRAIRFENNWDSITKYFA